MSTINFFTPIEFSSALPSSFKQSALRFVDDYFFLKGPKAKVIKLNDPTVRLLNRNSSFAMKCLKVASYFSIAFPLFIVSAKVVEKVQNRVIFEPTSNAWRYSKAASFLSLVPIIMFAAKVILRWNTPYQVSTETIENLKPESLGLDLTETVNLDRNDYEELFQPFIPESIIMRDAVEEVLNAINQGLRDNVNTSDDKNTVLISTNKYPWYKDSDKGLMGFYNLAVTGSERKYLPKTEETWLYRILKAIELKGVIKIMLDTGHGYTVRVLSRR